MLYLALELEFKNSDPEKEIGNDKSFHRTRDNIPQLPSSDIFLASMAKEIIGASSNTISNDTREQIWKLVLKTSQLARCNMKTQ